MNTWRAETEIFDTAKPLRQVGIALRNQIAGKTGIGVDVTRSEAGVTNAPS